MLGNEKHREAGKNIFIDSLMGLANMLALIAAFLLTPKVHGWSVGWVTRYVEEQYGAGLSDLTGFAWFVVVGFTIFFGSRATIGTALVMGGLAILTRFL